MIMKRKIIVFESWFTKRKMSKEEKEKLQEELVKLDNSFTGDLVADGELHDRMLVIKRQLGISPDACSLDSDDCESCSG